MGWAHHLGLARRDLKESKGRTDRCRRGTHPGTLDVVPQLWAPPLRRDLAGPVPAVDQEVPERGEVGGRGIAAGHTDGGNGLGPRCGSRRGRLDGWRPQSGERLARLARINTLLLEGAEDIVRGRHHHAFLKSSIRSSAAVSSTEP